MLIDYLPEALRQRWRSQREAAEDQVEEVILELDYHFPRLRQLGREKRSLWLQLAAQTLGSGEAEAEGQPPSDERLRRDLAACREAYSQELERVARYLAAAEPLSGQGQEGLCPPCTESCRHLEAEFGLPELEHGRPEDWVDFPLLAARNWLAEEGARQRGQGPAPAGPDRSSSAFGPSVPENPRAGSPAYREALRSYLEETGLGAQLEGDFARYRLDIFPVEERRAMQGLRRMLEAYCRDFQSPWPVTRDLSERPSLYLWGRPGTGKSFAAHCVVRDLLERGWDVVYLNSTELFLHFTEYERQQTSYRPDPERLARQEYLHRRLREAELLVVDDLGRELRSAAGLEHTDALINLLDSRRQERRPCIFTSNFSNRQLKEAVYDGRVFSRLGRDFRMLPLQSQQDLRLLNLEGETRTAGDLGSQGRGQ